MRRGFSHVFFVPTEGMNGVAKQLERLESQGNNLRLAIACIIHVHERGIIDLMSEYVDSFQTLCTPRMEFKQKVYSGKSQQPGSLHFHNGWMFEHVHAMETGWKLQCSDIANERTTELQCGFGVYNLSVWTKMVNSFGRDILLVDTLHELRFVDMENDKVLKSISIAASAGRDNKVELNDIPKLSIPWFRRMFIDEKRGELWCSSCEPDYSCDFGGRCIVFSLKLHLEEHAPRDVRIQRTRGSQGGGFIECRPLVGAGIVCTVLQVGSVKIHDDILELSQLADFGIKKEQRLGTLSFPQRVIISTIFIDGIYVYCCYTHDVEQRTRASKEFQKSSFCLVISF